MEQDIDLMYEQYLDSTVEEQYLEGLATQSEQDAQRYKEWCVRIPGYAQASKNQKKHMKKRYNSNMSTLNIPSVGCENTVTQFIIDDFVPSAPAIPKPMFVSYTPTKWVNNIPTSKEANMYNEITVREESDEAKQRSYLSSRMGDAHNDQNEKLRKQFFMDDDTRPTNPKALVERILAGKYLMSKKVLAQCEDGDYFYDLADHISWRDPSKPADKAGYEAAEKKLMVLYTATQDSINIGTPAEGLKALQAFEAATV